MDKKNIERPTKFNQKEYNKQYTKDNYKRFNTVIKPDLMERINNYCIDNRISKADFLLYAMDLMDKYR